MQKWIGMGLLVLIGLSGCLFSDAQEASLKLRILATTDLHCNAMDYDYYRDNPIEDFGLARTATLMQKARTDNTLLFDNGDLIQGNPMGDYVARVQGLPAGAVHPMHKAMNFLKYDAAGFGNHEFNYGLEFLNRVIAGADFPYICSNLYNASGTEHYFKPYVILDRYFLDQAGEKRLVRIGVLSVLPPQVIQWDAGHLAGKLVAKDMVESVRALVPVLQEQGADVIVVLAHAGIEFVPTQENTVYWLAQIPGVHAIIAGHTHDTFPSEKYRQGPNVNIQKGTIQHAAVALAGAYGNHLGVIDISLELKQGKWHVADQKSEVWPLIQPKDGVMKAVPAAPLVQAVVKQDHENTLAYVRKEVGKTLIPLHTYTAQVQDNPVMELINQAQIWYIQEKLKDTEYQDLPMLGAAAPFKCGGRGGPTSYTDVPAGALAIKDIANVYVYPNTLKALCLTGEEVREWLEMSAVQFRQLDIQDTKPQSLLNEEFPSFNFDILDGVTFEIDITQPPRYDMKGNLIGPQSHRIVNLCYQGKPIDAQQKFIVVTNNYRAYGGGNFPGLNGSKIVYSGTDEVRQVIVAYIQQQKTIDPKPNGNWRFTDWPKELRVCFPTGPKFSQYAQESPQLKALQVLENGFAQYEIEENSQK